MVDSRFEARGPLPLEKGAASKPRPVNLLPSRRYANFVIPLNNVARTSRSSATLFLRRVIANASSPIYHPIAILFVDMHSAIFSNVENRILYSRKA